MVGVVCVACAWCVFGVCLFFCGVCGVSVFSSGVLRVFFACGVWMICVWCVWWCKYLSSEPQVYYSD